MEDHCSSPLFPSGYAAIDDTVLEQTLYNLSDSIVSLVNLPQLVPFLAQHNLLTKSEQDYLSDDKEPHDVRIRRQVIPLLFKGGGHVVASFHSCLLAASDGHPGHVILARKMRQEFSNELTQMERRDLFHLSYVERPPCMREYHPKEDLFDQGHKVIVHLARKWKKHIGDDLYHGKLQVLATMLGMSYDIGSHLVTTFEGHELYNKVLEYYLNGMCGVEPTAIHLVLSLMRIPGLGRLTCHVCDIWGSAPSFYTAIIAKHLSVDWPILARYLGFTEQEIADIQDTHFDDVQQQASAFFLLWQVPDCGPHVWDLLYYAFYYADLKPLLTAFMSEIHIAKSDLNLSLMGAQVIMRRENLLKTMAAKKQSKTVKKTVCRRQNLVPSIRPPSAKKLALTRANAWKPTSKSKPERNSSILGESSHIQTPPILEMPDHSVDKAASFDDITAGLPHHSVIEPECTLPSTQPLHGDFDFGAPSTYIFKEGIKQGSIPVPSTYIFKEGIKQGSIPVPSHQTEDAGSNIVQICSPGLRSDEIVTHVKSNGDYSECPSLHPTHDSEVQHFMSHACLPLPNSELQTFTGSSSQLANGLTPLPSSKEQGLDRATIPSSSLRQEGSQITEVTFEPRGSDQVSQISQSSSSEVEITELSYPPPLRSQEDQHVNYKPPSEQAADVKDLTFVSKDSQPIQEDSSILNQTQSKSVASASSLPVSNQDHLAHGELSCDLEAELTHATSSLEKEVDSAVDVFSVPSQQITPLISNAVVKDQPDCFFPNHATSDSDAHIDSSSDLLPVAVCPVGTLPEAHSSLTSNQNVLREDCSVPPSVYQDSETQPVPEKKGIHEDSLSPVITQQDFLQRTQSTIPHPEVARESYHSLPHNEAGLTEQSSSLPLPYTAFDEDSAPFLHVKQEAQSLSLPSSLPSALQQETNLLPSSTSLSPVSQGATKENCPSSPQIQMGDLSAVERELDIGDSLSSSPTGFLIETSRDNSTAPSLKQDVNPVTQPSSVCYLPEQNRNQMISASSHPTSVPKMSENVCVQPLNVFSESSLDDERSQSATATLETTNVRAGEEGGSSDTTNQKHSLVIQPPPCSPPVQLHEDSGTSSPSSHQEFVATATSLPVPAQLDVQEQVSSPILSSLEVQNQPLAPRSQSLSLPVTSKGTNLRDLSDRQSHVVDVMDISRSLLSSDIGDPPKSVPSKAEGNDFINREEADRRVSDTDAVSEENVLSNSTGNTHNSTQDNPDRNHLASPRGVSQTNEVSEAAIHTGRAASRNEWRFQPNDILASLKSKQNDSAPDQSLNSVPTSTVSDTPTVSAESSHTAPLEATIDNTGDFVAVAQTEETGQHQEYTAEESQAAFRFAVEHLNKEMALTHMVLYSVFINDEEHQNLFCASQPPQQVTASNSELLTHLSTSLQIDDNLVMTLLDSGADLSVRDEVGAQPLHHAVNRGLCDIAKSMITRGADLNSSCIGNKFGWTPLGTACHHGNMELVELLLEHEADPNKCDFLGRHCLLLGSVLRNQRMLQKVLDAGADVNKTATGYKVTPLALACLLGEVDTCKLLLQRGANPSGEPGATDSPLTMAVMAPSFEVVKLLLDLGAVVDGVNHDMYTALHTACLLRQYPVVELLLDHGADVNKQNTTLAVSPLMTAVTGGSVDIVRLLLSKGADLSACRSLRSVTVSPLGEAALCGNADVFDLLVDHGAQLDYCSKGAVSVLTLACAGGCEDIVDFMMKANDMDLTLGPPIELAVVLAFRHKNTQCLEAVTERIGMDALWKYAEDTQRTAMMDALKSLQRAVEQTNATVEVSSTQPDPSPLAEHSPHHHQLDLPGDAVSLRNDLSDDVAPNVIPNNISSTQPQLNSAVDEHIVNNFTDISPAQNALQQPVEAPRKPDSTQPQENAQPPQRRQFDSMLQSIARDQYARRQLYSFRSGEEERRFVSLFRFLIIAAGDINELIIETVETELTTSVMFLTAYTGGEYDSDDALVAYSKAHLPNPQLFDFIVRKSFSLTPLIELAQGLDHQLAYKHFKQMQQYLDREGRAGLPLLEILGLDGACRLIDVQLDDISVPQTLPAKEPQSPEVLLPPRVQHPPAQDPLSGALPGPPAVPDVPPAVQSGLGGTLGGSQSQVNDSRPDCRIEPSEKKDAQGPSVTNNGSSAHLNPVGGGNGLHPDQNDSAGVPFAQQDGWTSIQNQLPGMQNDSTGTNGGLFGTPSGIQNGLFGAPNSLAGQQNDVPGSGNSLHDISKNWLHIRNDDPPEGSLWSNVVAGVQKPTISVVDSIRNDFSPQLGRSELRLQRIHSLHERDQTAREGNPIATPSKVTSSQPSELNLFTAKQGFIASRQSSGAASKEGTVTRLDPKPSQDSKGSSSRPSSAVASNNISNPSPQVNGKTETVQNSLTISSRNNAPLPKETAHEEIVLSNVRDRLTSSSNPQADVCGLEGTTHSGPPLQWTKRRVERPSVSSKPEKMKSRENDFSSNPAMGSFSEAKLKQWPQVATKEGLGIVSHHPSKESTDLPTLIKRFTNNFNGAPTKGGDLFTVPTKLSISDPAKPAQKRNNFSSINNSVHHVANDFITAGKGMCSMSDDSVTTQRPLAAPAHHSDSVCSDSVIEMSQPPHLVPGSGESSISVHNDFLHIPDSSESKSAAFGSSYDSLSHQGGEEADLTRHDPVSVDVDTDEQPRQSTPIRTAPDRTMIPASATDGLSPPPVDVSRHATLDLTMVSDTIVSNNPFMDAAPTTIESSHSSSVGSDHNNEGIGYNDDTPEQLNDFSFGPQESNEQVDLVDVSQLPVSQEMEPSDSESIPSALHETAETSKSLLPQLDSELLGATTGDDLPNIAMHEAHVSHSSSISPKSSSNSSHLHNNKHTIPANTEPLPSSPALLSRREKEELSETCPSRPEISELYNPTGDQHPVRDVSIYFPPPSKFDEFCDGCRCVVVDVDIDLSDVRHRDRLKQVSRTVDSKWTMLIRKLGIAEETIVEVKEGYETPAERCNQLLMRWVQRKCNFKSWVSNDDRNLQWSNLQEALCSINLCFGVQEIHTFFNRSRDEQENSESDEDSNDSGALCPQPTSATLSPQDPRLVELCFQMSSHWRVICRHMNVDVSVRSIGFTDSDMAFDMISRWIDANGMKATEDCLRKTLQECQLGYLCTIIE